MDSTDSLDFLFIHMVDAEMKLKDVTRAEYRSFVRANCNPENDRPVTGTDIAAMQHVDDSGNLIAQAVYYKGLSPVYRVKK